MDGKFQRILSLVRRTGDRVIVTDSEGSDAYVLMSLEAYEGIMDVPVVSTGPVSHPVMEEKSQVVADQLSAPPPVIAHAPAVSVPSTPLPASEPKRIWDVMGDAQVSGQTWDPTKLTESERSVLAQTLEHMRGQVNVSPSVSEMSKEEAGESEAGEEQFYLEPIE